MADKDKALQALSQALKLEQDGRTFYLKAAKETLDPTGKKMFQSLADDERMHAEMIQRQLHSVEGDGVYVLLPDLEAPDIDLGNKLFPPDKAKIEAKVGDNPSDVDAIFIALENETKSYNLYAKAAQETADEAAQAMYTWLAGAERTHFDLLMSNYEAMVSLGGWV